MKQRANNSLIKKHWLKKSAGMILIVSVMAGFIQVRNTGSLKRKRFERFLVKEYQAITKLTVQDQEETMKPDRPELAAYQDFLMTVDPADGTVPRHRLVAAAEILKKKMTEKKGVAWNISWTSQPSDMGGRTRALLFDPSDTSQKRIFAASVTGGIWVNEDITSPSERWTPVNDFMENLSISCLVADPLHPEILYAGTGEPQTAVTIYRESSGLGTGILKSTDGGKTWASLPATAGFRYVTDLAMRVEQDTAVLYAGVISGEYKGVIHLSVPTNGLYRSADGGVSWQQVLPKIPGEKHIFPPADIEISPDGRIFVGTMRDLFGGGGGYILYSDNGYDWAVYDSMYREITQIADSTENIPGRVIIASAPSDTSRVYAVVAGGGRTEAGFIFYRAHAILRSEDGGLTWHKTAMPTDDGTWAYLAWHALTLAVDPNDANTVYAGGLDQHKSTDGGMTWHKISDWAGMYDGGGNFPYLHADQHKVLFRKNSSDEIVFATDGGVFYTQNGSADYPDFSARNQRFNTLQFYTCAISPVSGSSQFLAGAQDNGTLFFKGVPVTEADMISGGDGTYCFFDSDQPDYFITSVYYNRYFVYLSLSGLNATLKHYIDSYYSGVFVNPADYDSRLDKLYANAVSFEGNNPDQILRIDDIRTSPSGTFLTMNTGTEVYFSAIRVSPYSPAGHTTLFAGTQSGKFYRADLADEIPQVTEIGYSGFPAANISCIATGMDENHLLITFSNYGVSSVWETADGGVSWTDVEGDLPDMPVRWAMYNPGDARSALIATELGVWMCDNLDAVTVSWYPVNNGMANVRTDMLRYRPSDGLILAATHGRGLFTTFSLSTGKKKIKRAGAGLTLYPNPASGFVNLKADIPGKYFVEIYTLEGKRIIQRKVMIPGGNIPVSLDVSDVLPGTYILRLRNKHRSESIRFVISR